MRSIIANDLMHLILVFYDSLSSVYLSLCWYILSIIDGRVFLQLFAVDKITFLNELIYWTVKAFFIIWNPIFRQLHSFILTIWAEAKTRSKLSLSEWILFSILLLFNTINPSLSLIFNHFLTTIITIGLLWIYVCNCNFGIRSVICLLSLLGA